ncbi:hypothetical protein CVT25_009503 [Psilocybe cyanescens]|uniref:Uncharacterized protein n=1 Tax=Psilocybe cyanescens TaxID=93625 RepID=A0A409XAU9_PSICY|nr:hypothetical protein CVT25_009503 [Psilocybe cyanescens]
MSDIKLSTSISDLFSHINLDDEDMKANKLPHNVNHKKKAPKLGTATRDEQSKGKQEEDPVSDPGPKSTPEHDFEAFLYHIEAISSILDKPLVDSANYPPPPIEEHYLDSVRKYWIDKGLIPPALIRRVPQHEDPKEPKINNAEQSKDPKRPRTNHPFYERIMGSVAYSLQHPKATAPGSRRDPHYALGRFIDAHIASRRGMPHKVPFKAFCIVDTEVGHIPDHYGHSAWTAKATPPREKDDIYLDTMYRRALVYPSLKGEVPELPVSLPNFHHSIEHCAENIAFPYIRHFARDFLANGTNGRNIVIGSLTMALDKTPIPFCVFCRTRAWNECDAMLGLCIVDRAGDPPVFYQSSATVSLIPATV